jgi:hypothetical protein
MLDPVSEQNVDRYIQEEDKVEERARNSATPELSARIAEIYRQSPWMTPAQVLALAKGNASQEAVDFASQQQAKQVGKELDPNKPERGWFDRNIMGKVRAGSRWTFAALDFIPEFVQGGVAQFGKPGDTLFQEGWFTATKFGTAIQNPEMRGEGWFMGESETDPETGRRYNVLERKAGEKARAYRGEINGNAWTIGRGAANLVFTPGSKAYGVASGLLDAVVNITMDPTVLGGKAIAPFKAARALTPSIKTASEASDVASALKAGLRTQAGIQKSDQLLADGSKFVKFWTTDRRARRLVDRLADPANDDAYSIMMDQFGGKIDIATALRFSEAKTTEDVLGVLADVGNRLDDANPNLIPEDIRQIRGAKQLFLSERVPFFNNFRRSSLLTEMPKQRIVMGTGQDNAEAVQNMGNFLNTIKGGYTATDEGKTLMAKMMRSLESEDALDFEGMNDVYDQAVKLLLKSEGATDGQIDEILASARKAVTETERYFLDIAGQATDGGFLKAAIASGMIDPQQFKNLSPQQIDELELVGPGTLLELSKRVKMLPDIRQVRRITANPFVKRAITRKSGQARLPVEFVETVQNEIWKPLALMTGGYIFRNMIEAQVRIATVGKAGFFNHPLRYVQYAMGKKGTGTITGRNIKELIDSYVKDVTSDEVGDTTFELFNEVVRSNIKDPVAATRNAARNGAWKTVDRRLEPELWRQGLIDEAVQIAMDPAMNAMAKGVGTDEYIDYLRTMPKGRRYLEVLERALKSGFKYASPDGKTTYVKIDDVNDEVLTEWLERLNRARVELKTGGDDELKFALGYRQVPKGPVDDIDVNDVIERIDGPQTGKGRLVRYYGLDNNGNVVERVGVQISDDPAQGLSRIQVRETSGNDVVDSVEGREELAAFIKSKIDDFDANPAATGFPPSVKIAERSMSAEKRGIMDRMTDRFFNGLYGGLTRNLEKSPLFRQYYYDYVVKEVDAISLEDAQKLVTQVKSYAAQFKVSPANYVGSKEIWAKLQKAAVSNKSDGLGTLDQLDDYAKIRAIRGVKETLYDASSRNNLEDIARVVVPFGIAWREIITRFGKFAIEDPTRIRRAQLMYSGAEKADYDQDGQGIFFKDPISGENSFLLPLSGELAQLITGVNAPLKGEVRRMSMGLQFTPGAGPMVQLAASQLIPDTPKADSLTKFLLPYGRKEVSLDMLAPSYAMKVKSALFDDPNKMDTIYGNTYMDVVRAKMTSGDYGMDEDSKARLLEEAKTPAKVLTLMRALAQFIGPVAPSNEFIIKNAENVDMLASAVSQEFYRMQNENYQDAVKNALEMFGEDAFLYFAAKTEAQVGGVQPTDVFVDWERNNGGFLDRYSLIGGYFAPGGDAFSFEAWDRMKKAGQIRELTPKELWEKAQYRVGASIYRYYREQVGAYPTDEQREWLRGVRQAINRRYSGFPATPVFTVGEFEQKIVQLKQAVADPQMQGNEVARAIGAYLDYRDQAIARYEASGGSAQGFGTAKAAAPLREWLVSIGTAIGDKTPEFQRIWDRELMNEVDS